MKFCELCSCEIDGKDGENLCHNCEEHQVVTEQKRRKRNAERREREQALRDMGLKKIIGALGGTYWE